MIEESGSINEPGNSRQSFTPASINEPPKADDVDNPKATGMDPTSIAYGDPDVTLKVTGTGFNSDTFIVFNDAPLPTAVISTTELDGSLSTGTLEVGDYPVTVGRGSYVSQPAMMFSVGEPIAPRHAADPDELEEEIEEAEENDEFKPLHRGKASHTLPHKRKK